MPGLVRRSPLLSVLVATALLGACTGPADAPAESTLAPAERTAASDPKGAPAAADVTTTAAAHQANPTDSAAALAYARALRASNDRLQALAVLDKTAASKPGDRRLLLERGFLALELGDTAKAEKLLRQAQDPKVPDWRVHSGLGAALASGGKQREAQVEFAKALALAPDQPSVLNNLALSYALDGKTAQAEALLRKAGRAGKAPQVRENLALVLGLRGKYDEARSLAQAGLTPAEANENVAYLRQLASAGPGPDSAGSTSDPSAALPARKASVSLPQPTYQLGGPLPASR
jgi:Flp pilus assembly protein TadD